MKQTNTIFAIILLMIFAGCGEIKQSNDELIIVDISKSYPKKELILQDFMDVDYIPLETNDDYLCQGLVQAIGRDIILVRNRINDGDIFVFDRKTGKGLKKINRKGNGGEEYTAILEIAIDEDNGEMFVNDLMANRILVYDFEGEFKRRFLHKDGSLYNGIYNFDGNNIICNDSYHSEKGVANQQSFLIISKNDGSMTKEIQIPFNEKISTWITMIDEANSRISSSSPRNHFPIIPYLGDFILTEPSSDTVYMYQFNHLMIPIIVRTPSVQSMDPEIFLFPGIFTDRYCFMKTVEKVWDFSTNRGYPTIDLVYDKYEKSMFECVVYNNDYEDKRPIDLTSKFVNDEVAYWRILEANDLIEDYEENRLKGQLKEIAATLNEESNPVIMIAKHKR